MMLLFDYLGNFERQKFVYIYSRENILFQQGGANFSSCWLGVDFSTLLDVVDQHFGVCKGRERRLEIPQSKFLIVWILSNRFYQKMLQIWSRIWTRNLQILVKKTLRMALVPFQLSLLISGHFRYQILLKLLNNPYFRYLKLFCAMESLDGPGFGTHIHPYIVCKIWRTQN